MRRSPVVLSVSGSGGGRHGGPLHRPPTRARGEKEEGSWARGLTPRPPGLTPSRAGGPVGEVGEVGGGERAGEGPPPQRG